MSKTGVFSKSVLLLACASLGAGRGVAQRKQEAAPRHNVIVFVADGLRRGSVTRDDMPTFFALRQRGVDFRNSHAVFPTFTTANASAIATGHGLGDTGDYSNVIWPGTWLAKPDAAPDAAGYLTPFLENDEVLADMNATFGGNYLGEETLLSAARKEGYAVAAVGKLGPTAIQQVGAVSWSETGNGLWADGTILVDDSTGQTRGLPLPREVLEAMEARGLGAQAPARTNGFAESNPRSNGFAGDAVTPGTREANKLQEQWMADVTTEVLLPRFTEEKKPFVLLFWSRDPDGTQHNQGDSLQQMAPGINGATSKLALRNADHCLKQLLDWLHAHPAVEATTDVLVTSDHGFATITRRELAADGAATGEPSAALEYALGPTEKAEPKGTLPTGFLAIDLAIRQHLKLFDTAQRASTGKSVFKELAVGGERSEHPEMGSALLAADAVQRLDGSDADLMVAANGGSDLIYAPTRNASTVQKTVTTLGALDYVGGIFADESLCGGASMSACPGALPLGAVGLTGASKVPRPAIVVAFKLFYARPGDLQSALQISDTNLQEGQGMHGGFGREQTWNNMAAAGPDFKAGYVDEAPMGNIDIAPTLARILGFTMPAVGTLRGRVVAEALKGGASTRAQPGKVLVSAPGPDGRKTVLHFQEAEGVRYLDRGCFVADAKAGCE